MEGANLPSDGILASEGTSEGILVSGGSSWQAGFWRR